MAHDPKLEIFKIILKPKGENRSPRFRDSFRGRIASISSLAEKTPENIYREYHRHFQNSIDLAGYKTDDTRLKAIKIKKKQIEGGGLQSIINPITDDNFIIKGLINGGKYGVNRNLGNVDNATDDKEIHKKHVVGDDYYYLLYTPIDSNIGLIMVQGYTDNKVSDILREHIRKYFEIANLIACEIEVFVHKTLKDKYLESALFKSVSFSTDYVVTGEMEDATQKDFELNVKIEIVDKSRSPLSYKDTHSIIRFFNDSFLKLKNVQKDLTDFRGKKARIVSKGKELPFVFDNEDEVVPRILLKDQGIAIGDGHVPNFDQIEAYCTRLLEDIKREILPQYAVENT